jgi:hypothetical protein
MAHRKKRRKFEISQVWAIVLLAALGAGAAGLSAAALAPRTPPASTASVAPDNPQPAPEPAEPAPTFQIGALDFVPTLEEEGDVRGSLNGQNVRLMFDPNVPHIGTAIWAHGQGGNADARMTSSWFRVLTEVGWVIASSDMHGNNWGNESAVQSLVDLDAWAQSLAPTEQTMMIAASMGSMATLNALRFGAVEAQCWYGTMPAIDTDAIRSTLPTADAQIQAAYGGIVPDPYKVQLNSPPLPDGTSYHVRYSNADTLVPPSQHAEVLLSLLGERATSSEATGEHGDETHFDPFVLADFASSCAP